MKLCRGGEREIITIRGPQCSWISTAKPLGKRSVERQVLSNWGARGYDRGDVGLQLHVTGGRRDYPMKQCGPRRGPAPLATLAPGLQSLHKCARIASYAMSEFQSELCTRCTSGSLSRCGSLMRVARRASLGPRSSISFDVAAVPARKSVAREVGGIGGGRRGTNGKCVLLRARSGAGGGRLRATEQPTAVGELREKQTWNL
ncbi:unnamed protein product, partial [Iphiclides podalirius]